MGICGPRRSGRRRILFDTGANEDTVQRNLKVMGLDLSGVEIVVLSHNHADHTTGLLPLRRQFAAKAPNSLHGLRWQRHLLATYQRRRTG